MSVDTEALAAAHLQTPRLQLRPYLDADIDALHALWTDPAVRRFLWDDLVISRAQAAEVVAESVEDWRTRGWGQWNATLRDGGETVGFCGFRASSWDDAPELVFGLAPAFWGRGLAAEAGSAALRFGVERGFVTKIEWSARVDSARLSSLLFDCQPPGVR